MMQRRVAELWRFTGFRFGNAMSRKRPLLNLRQPPRWRHRTRPMDLEKHHRIRSPGPAPCIQEPIENVAVSAVVGRWQEPSTQLGEQTHEGTMMVGWLFPGFIQRQGKGHCWHFESTNKPENGGRHCKGDVDCRLGTTWPGARQRLLTIGLELMPGAKIFGVVTTKSTPARSRLTTSDRGDSIGCCSSAR